MKGLTLRPDYGWAPRAGRRVRYLAGFGSGTRYGVHDNNLQNLVRGITERILYVQGDEGLVPPPLPVKGAFQRLSGLRGRLLRRMPPTPIMDIKDYPGCYSGRKRAVYQRAVDSLESRGVSTVDSYVSAFIKAEKINLSAKADPVPRIIQSCSSRYNASIGVYLKPYEKRVFAGFEREFGYPVILKGMNAQQIGGWMKRHWDHFDHPVGIGLDASRFDQHVSREALLYEFGFYNGAFKDKELARLLRMQLTVHGIGRVDGWRLDYIIEYCRMSGVLNTSLGNCIIMATAVIGYCEYIGIDFRLANNGDDCVLFVDKRDLRRLDGIVAWMKELAFKLTIEDPVYELERVVFCQAQPVYTSTGWRMVRDPRTAMSKDCVSLVGWATDTDFRAWATAIGKCGLSLTAGVPVWESWYRALIEIGGDCDRRGVEERVQECGMYYMSRGVEAGEIVDEARASFYRAFGILPDLQTALEQWYARPTEIDPLTPREVRDLPSLDQSNNPLAAWLAIA